MIASPDRVCVDSFLNPAAFEDADLKVTILSAMTYVECAFTCCTHAVKASPSFVSSVVILVQCLLNAWPDISGPGCYKAEYRREGGTSTTFPGMEQDSQRGPDIYRHYTPP